ncbi:helix-turn-helix domain-containing protein [Halobacterium sp. R2-5]|uniref:helix-turn-helix domain-containing protein n=1 Tax=Halobacterium sp. R2-5 TaxID=2715751 RepID=UPI001421674B|nr:bacterio-opsin activator [Halobacterium sp. R2-5]
MSFIAEFRIEIPPLAEASKAVPEMRFSGKDVVLEDDQARKFRFAAHGSQFDKFEAALDADPTVADYTVLTTTEDSAHYVVTYAATADTRGTYPIAIEHDIAYLDIELQDGEYTVRARVPDRDALTALREYCRANDFPFTLDRIYQETAIGAVGNPLTDAQAEAMRVAYEQGYFDSPRQTTLDAIADEIGVSRQAVAARLRRGHKRLIETTDIPNQS